MTREEAIKEIKSWAIPSKNGRKVLETLIPELAESEDERARKWLLDYAIEMIAGLESDISLSNYDGIKGHDPEAEAELAQWQKARAYLEKQKNLDKMIVVSPEVWDNAISDAYENGKKDEEKQKEQKPIEIDKEINRWMGCEAFPEGTNITPLPQAMEIVERTAKHFFELGEKTVPSPGGYWEGFNAGVRECQAKSRDAKGAMKEQEPELYYDKELDNAAREFYLSGGAVSPIDSTGLVPIVRMAEFGATWMKERMEKEQKPCWNPTEEDVALFNKAITTNASLSPQERAKLDILRMKFKHRPVIEQKEQKPAECADDVVEEAEEYTSKVDCGEYGAEVTEAYIAGVLAERNRGIEWNEEDEKDMTHIIRILDDCYAYGKHDLSKTDHENLVNKLLVIKLLVIKLKSLRPQLKQNDMITPNKEFFQWIYNRLVDVHKENPNMDYMISFKRRIEELSFDKPSWKPSEEQMNALKNSAYGTYQNGDGPVLRGLYEQLLKLGVK